ncbi:response regulator [Alteromonas aestuariivivens]|uniref:Response regulator n=1 Tax=Alteromonas aestuariivivens TaxID=1938339 RepID=A0A3D8ME01_9ALTE|nr:response regulator [Alteromonas aestuariivivens]RDV28962.1 response regulator [Alteromonas aestuariivivens]
MPSNTIAVIDDDPVAMEILCRTLEKFFDATVLAFPDSRQARDFLMQATSRSLDVIISDQNMPHLNGLSLLQFCRAQELSIPFIMVTADALRDDVLAARALGAVAFFAKPVVLPDLIEKIRGLLETKM